MPLKHSTETVLVILLCIAIILAGITCALLPPLQVSPLSWVIAFGVSLAYPLALYPLFKDRRADYSFRALHFIPAIMLLVWFLLQLLSTYRPSTAPLAYWYTWGWSLPVVSAAIIALALFCVNVIRAWIPRLAALALLFVLFLAFSVVGEQFRWPAQIASLLSTPAVPAGSGTIIIGSVTSAGSSNLAHSADSSEERWRAELRRMERRKDRLAELEKKPSSVHSATDGAYIASQSGSLISAVIPTSPVTKPIPPHLPSSGMNTEALLLAMAAFYCALIHQRARRRVLDY